MDTTPRLSLASCPSPGALAAPALAALALPGLRRHRLDTTPRDPVAAC
jgi:hypothetical protein